MRYILHCILCFTCSFALGQEKPASKEPAARQQADSIDFMVTSVMKKELVPGSTLMAIKNGKMLKATSYGMANLEHRVSTKFSTVYEFASVSNPMTAMAVMQLVEQGKIALDSSITSYIYGVPITHTGILVRHLLSHTSGLGRVQFNSSRVHVASTVKSTVKEQLDNLFKPPLVFAPGEGFQPSDAGYFLLALIISNTSGMTYENYVQKNVFDKALMSHTRFINSDSIVVNRAQTYTKRNGKQVRFSLEVTESMDVNGFSGVMSTTGDLIQLSMAMFDGKILSESSVEQMKTPVIYKGKKPAADSLEAGLGWYVRDINGKKCIVYIGQAGSAMVNCPEEKFSLVLLSNLASGYESLGDHGFDVKKLALDISTKFLK